MYIVNKWCNYCTYSKPSVETILLQFQEKVTKYNSVIEEGKIMRYKTLQRATKEEQSCRQKEREVEGLRKELDDLRLKYEMIILH